METPLQEWRSGAFPDSGHLMQRCPGALKNPLRACDAFIAKPYTSATMFTARRLLDANRDQDDTGDQPGSGWKGQQPRHGTEMVALTACCILVTA